jgi:hypothetical protein
MHTEPRRSPPSTSIFNSATSPKNFTSRFSDEIRTLVSAPPTCARLPCHRHARPTPCQLPWTAQQQLDEWQFYRANHGNYKRADYNKQPQTHSTASLSLVGISHFRGGTSSELALNAHIGQDHTHTRSHNGEDHNNHNRTTPFFSCILAPTSTLQWQFRLCTHWCSDSTGIPTAPAPLHFTFTFACFYMLSNHNISHVSCNHDRQPRFGSNSDSRHKHSTLEKNSVH